MAYLRKWKRIVAIVPITRKKRPHQFVGIL